MQVFQANCLGGVVTADKGLVQDAIILSAGKGQSDGIVMMSADKVAYVANTSGDTDTLISQLSAMIDIMSDLCNAISQITVTAPPSGTTSPPLNAAQFVAISSQFTGVKAQLDALQGVLK